MTESRFAKHLTNEQLGAAFRGALQLNGIMNEISDKTPSIPGLLRDVDHEVEKMFPDVVREVRAAEIKVYKESVDAVFRALTTQRDGLLSRVEEFFEEFRIDSAHDAVQEQLDGATFEQWAEEAPVRQSPAHAVVPMMRAVAYAIQAEITIRGGHVG